MMQKSILDQYIDACELVKESEDRIAKLRGNRSTVHDTVIGSSPEFPYTVQHYKIEGTPSRELAMIDAEERILLLQRGNANALQAEVENWMIGIPARMQRIIRAHVFDRKSWRETAEIIGRGANEYSVRKEFERFMKKNAKMS